MDKKKVVKKLKVILHYVRIYILLFIGTLVASMALENFLIPNDIIDGGVVGISLLVSQVSQVPYQFFLVIVNIPFLILGYRKMGRGFIIASFFAISTLSLNTRLLHQVPRITEDVVLAAIFGGLFLGIGVGLIIRFGAALDGTEIMAIILGSKTPFSIGQIVMVFNIFIFSAAGFIFGWDKAMYAVLTYFIAFKTIDVTINGLNELKQATIVTALGPEIVKRILSNLDGGVTIVNGRGGYSKEEKDIVYTIIPRLEISKLKNLVLEVDPKAFICFNDVFDVMGGRHKSYDIYLEE